MSSYHIVPELNQLASPLAPQDAPESRYDAEVRLLIAAVLESRRAYRLAVSLAKDVMLSSHVDQSAAQPMRTRVQPAPIRFSALVSTPPTSRGSNTPLRLVRTGEMASVSNMETTGTGEQSA